MPQVSLTQLVKYTKKIIDIRMNTYYDFVNNMGQFINYVILFRIFLSQQCRSDNNPNCNLQHMQFVTRNVQQVQLATHAMRNIAICNTCNLKHMQFATLAICNTCNLRYLQFATHVISNMFNLEHVQFSICLICNTCNLQNVLFLTNVICNMQNLQHMLFSPLAICNTCNLQQVQFRTCGIFQLYLRVFAFEIFLYLRYILIYS